VEPRLLLSEFLRDLSKDSFDAGSIFGRLHRSRRKLVFFGASFQACTFLHYVEQMHGIPYRYMKTFSGRIGDGAEEYEDSYAYLLRREPA
jgi:aminoglycoside 3-N-acetyltransferase